MIDLVERLREEGNLRVAEKEIIFGDWKTRDARIADDLCHRAANEIVRLQCELAAERESVADLAAETTRLTDAMIASQLAATEAQEKAAEARRQAFIEAAEIVKKRSAYWKSQKPMTTFTMTKEHMGEIFMEKRLALESIINFLISKADEI